MTTTMTEMKDAIKLLSGKENYPKNIQIHLSKNQHNIIEAEITIEYEMTNEDGCGRHEFRYELTNRDQWDYLGKAIGRSRSIHKLG